MINYLEPLGLKNIQFKIHFMNTKPTDRGSDSVQFLFSFNPGQPLAPLMEVASGGEMSRFLLGLKTILANSNKSGTLLFDEIDTGVSGRVSSAIAQVLKELGHHRQVFCITHQPLVAAAAEHHFSVSKAVSNGQTHSKVAQLINLLDRQNELVELAGGDVVEAKAYVQSLLKKQVA